MPENKETAVMQKPTEGPWAIDAENLVMVRDAEGNMIADCDVFQYTDDGEIQLEECPANARLIVAACNEFQRHFADPVAAAEVDVLGKMVEALRAAVDHEATFGPHRPEHPWFHRAEALLVQVRK